MADEKSPNIIQIEDDASGFYTLEELLPSLARTPDLPLSDDSDSWEEPPVGVPPHAVAPAVPQHDTQRDRIVDQVLRKKSTSA